MSAGKIKLVADFRRRYGHGGYRNHDHRDHGYGYGHRDHGYRNRGGYRDHGYRR
jgi:hypothetical protein